MRIDWSRIRYLFQIPLRWFADVDRRSRVIGDGHFIQVEKNNPDGTVLKFDETAIEFPDVPSTDTGTPVDHSDTNADDYSGGATWSWVRGSGNGLVIDAYCCIEEDGGWHYLQRCRLTFSKDGLMVRAEALAGQKEIEG